MVNIAALEAVNQHRWDVMHVQAARLGVLHARATVLCTTDNKARYQGVTDRLTELAAKDSAIYPVPWWFTAIVSEREYGGPPRWDRQLGQGDPLHQSSRHEPVGRGPFLEHEGDVSPGHDAWTRCCLDALIDCAPHAARWHLWTPGGVATIFEEYNGLGYAAMGVPSAYVWSGSDQYRSGKYVADHVYRAGVVDVQEGCMPLLAAMMAIDPDIAFPAANDPHPVPVNPQAVA